jgi:ClpX C4-type zinc finger/Clp amino terminal domain, pathogenicity island component
MEMGSPSLFDHLVARVVDTAASDDPRTRLDAAVVAAGEAADAGDRLLDHFVAQARHADLSWTDIGARLGVSKQAARQRFAERTQPLVLPGAAEPNSRLRTCLDQAGVVARADGAAEIGTHHLLAGLLAEGVAAAILERLGVTADAILASGHRLFGPPPDQPAEHVPPMSTEATCAVDAAARHAVTASPDSQCPEVRTEHLLFVLALDAGGRARRVLGDLGTDIAAIKRELECYVTGRPRRCGSRSKRPAVVSGRACSFCGRSEKVAGHLVAGPGVHICAGCVALAADILRREAA